MLFRLYFKHLKSQEWTMTCRELIEFLDEFLAGDQPPAVKAAFERHLAVCRECREYLRTYRDTVALSKAAQADATDAPCKAPEDLVQAILVARSRGG
jgi:predicted anti-sigma-YlaC factor YlaD